MSKGLSDEMIAMLGGEVSKYIFRILSETSKYETEADQEAFLKGAEVMGEIMVEAKALSEKVKEAEVDE